MEVQSNEPWPPLPYARGRTRWRRCSSGRRSSARCGLSLTPWLNHSWHVTLYVVGARARHRADRRCDGRALEIEFDFIDHVLWLRLSDGHFRQLMLRPVLGRASSTPTSMAALRALGIGVRIHEMPNEIAGAVRVLRGHAACELRRGRASSASTACCFLHTTVFAHFRTGFLGKASPVHFFWGSFDLAVTRFSGRPRAAASRRRAEPARRRGARGLFARGVERGLLAGRRARSIIRRSIPTPIRRRRALPRPRSRPPRRSGRRSLASSSCRMTRCGRAQEPDARADGISCRRTYDAAADLGTVGPGGAGMRAWGRREGEGGVTARDAAGPASWRIGAGPPGDSTNRRMCRAASRSGSETSVPASPSLPPRRNSTSAPIAEWR